MRLLDCRVGYVMNFNVTNLVKHGLQRRILCSPCLRPFFVIPPRRYPDVSEARPRSPAQLAILLSKCYVVAG